MSTKDIIVDFLSGKSDLSATLTEIYEAVKENSDTLTQTWQNSVRRTLYENKNSFRRVLKGVYMLTGEKSISLLINGDGRNLSEIEDESIDLIITDHPWSDTKSNKGGNRDFATYETFRYEPSDFEAKARVLKDGCYLAEFLPVENEKNWHYLTEIKFMAEKCGLNYYTSLIWRGHKEGTMNTGRCTKGVQQIIVFYKGKSPRKFSGSNIQGYATHSILPYELEFPVARQAKYRNHKAEKPIELYEYLIRQFTDEEDICLDQFGGACNMLKAAVNTNRFGIVYELAEEFVENAKNRLNLDILYTNQFDTTIRRKSDICTQYV